VYRNHRDSIVKGKSKEWSVGKLRLVLLWHSVYESEMQIE